MLQHLAHGAGEADRPEFVAIVCFQNGNYVGCGPSRQRHLLRETCCTVAVGDHP